MLKRSWIGYILICGGGLFLGFLVYNKCFRDYDAALEYYRRVSHRELEHATSKAETALDTIYRRMRALSLMPGRFAGNGAEPARMTEAEKSVDRLIFKGLRDAMGMPALYVLSLTSPQAMIVDENGPRPAGNGALRGYATVRAQMQWFAENYPVLAPAMKTDVPILSGHEPLAAGDDGFEDSLRWKTQSDAVFSIPYYGKDGRLAGVVAAVMPGDLLRNLLPDGDFALVNAGYVYVLEGEKRGQVERSTALVTAGKADPNVLYSETMPLDLRDPRSKWYVWCSHPDEDYHGSFGCARCARSS
jgi:hypothetical protein